jgi:hypothetical protein
VRRWFWVKAKRCENKAKSFSLQNEKKLVFFARYATKRNTVNTKAK